MKRVDPEAMYNLLCNHYGASVGRAVCPEVVIAEPEVGETIQWCPREPEHPTPSEPVIEEAVYAEAIRLFRQAFPSRSESPVGSVWRRIITGIVLKDRELRSNACGGSSERGSEQASSVSSPEPAKHGGVQDAAAPAADPRLTADEAADAYNAGLWAGSADHGDGLLAVADAQLDKAKVTISEAEIVAVIRANCVSRPGTVDVYLAPLVALLRRHGVEVK